MKKVSGVTLSNLKILYEAGEATEDEIKVLKRAGVLDGMEIKDRMEVEIDDEEEERKIKELNTGKVIEPTEEIKKKSEKSPLKAIRAYCMQCCESMSEVKFCTCVNCPLWMFRMGKNPFRKRELSEEQLKRVKEMGRANMGRKRKEE